MPGVINVNEFVRETNEDIKSPTTSNFVQRIPQCKDTVTKLEEVRYFLNSFLVNDDNIFLYKYLRRGIFFVLSQQKCVHEI